MEKISSWARGGKEDNKKNCSCGERRDDLHQERVTACSSTCVLVTGIPAETS